MEKQSKMCHCHDNLALLPVVAKILKEKMKREYIQIRCSIYEKKLLKKRAARAGISLSEYLRATAFKINMVERITQEQLECYQSLVQYKNNFSRISNMFKKGNPRLAKEVQELAEEIRSHLKNFKK
ncbi:mobilization protein MbpA [Gillisia mitskevichiae]|nr:mobilization protein MbpA [Gillisia mitskevichiae]